MPVTFDPTGRSPSEILRLAAGIPLGAEDPFAPRPVVGRYDRLFVPAIAPPPALESWAVIGAQPQDLITHSGEFLTLAARPGGPSTAPRMLVRSIPGAPYALTAGLSIDVPGNGDQDGLVLRESATGRTVTWVLRSGVEPERALRARKINNVTVDSDYYNTAAAPNQTSEIIGPGLWLRLQDTGTARRFLYAFAARVWFGARTSAVIPRTDYITPNQIGVVVWPSGSGNSTVTVFHWSTA